MNKKRDFFHIPSLLIEKTLQQTPFQGKHLLEPFRAYAKEHRIPINILEDKAVSNEPEVHINAADLWLCLEGEAIFICGGTLQGPHPKQNHSGTFDRDELVGTGIAGGKEVVMRKGDWLWIPAGCPHRHRAVGVARFMIIKVPHK